MERSDGSRIVKRLDLGGEYRKNLGALEKRKKNWLPMFFGVLGCCAGEGWPQYMWEIRRGTCQLIFYQTFQFLVFRDQFFGCFWNWAAQVREMPRICGISDETCQLIFYQTFHAGSVSASHFWHKFLTFGNTITR